MGWLASKLHTYSSSDPKTGLTSTPGKVFSHAVPHHRRDQQIRLRLSSLAAAAEPRVKRVRTHLDSTDGRTIHPAQPM